MFQLIFVVFLYVCGWMIASAEAAFAFFWTFGTWLPWGIDMVIGLAAPIVAPIWFVEWILHFAPQIVWPLFH